MLFLSLLSSSCLSCFSFFFFNDTATTEIYTLSYTTLFRSGRNRTPSGSLPTPTLRNTAPVSRSEEHTSELQSHHDLVCRLLLEKKKKNKKKQNKQKKNKKTQ